MYSGMDPPTSISNVKKCLSGLPMCQSDGDNSSVEVPLQRGLWNVLAFGEAMTMHLYFVLFTFTVNLGDSKKMLQIDLPSALDSKS